MLVSKLYPLKVKNFKKFWKLYKEGKIGHCLGQTLPDNIKKMKAGVDGTDQELIERVLSTDPDNFYFVQKVKGGYEITIIGLSFNKSFNHPVKHYYFLMGENGIWEEEKVKDDINDEDFDSDWDDSSVNGSISLGGLNVIEPVEYEESVKPDNQINTPKSTPNEEIQYVGYFIGIGFSEEQMWDILSQQR